MKWLEKLFRLDENRSNRLKADFFRNRFSLLYMVLLLGIGSGIAASGFSYLSPDTDSVKQRAEAARIEDAWNKEGSDLRFEADSNAAKISEALNQVGATYGVFGTGSLVNPCPISDNTEDEVLLSEWAGFYTIDGALPDSFKLLSGSLPTGDDEIAIPYVLASYISENGYSADGVEIQPGFSVSDLIGLPVYLTKANNYYVSYKESIYDSAELKPWFEEYGVKLTISGIVESADERYSSLSLCSVPLLDRLEKERFPVRVSYKTNFAGAPVVASDGWYAPNGTFEWDISYLSMISQDIPSVKGDLSVTAPTYGAEKVVPVYVPYNVFRSLMFSPASIDDWCAYDELLPANLNPTGAPIRVTASFDRIFGDLIQKLAGSFTACACFDPEVDYSGWYDEKEESEIYFQTEGKTQPDVLTDEERRDVFGFWISNAFSWRASAENDADIGKIQTEFDKNLEKLLDYFIGRYTNPRQSFSREPACIPHLPLYSERHEPIAELAVVGVVPDDYGAYSLFVDSPESCESLGGVFGSVVLDKEDHDAFLSGAEKLLNSGYSFFSDILPDYIFEEDLSLAFTLGTVLATVGCALLFSGVVWFAVWYVGERKRAGFDYLLPRLQGLSVLSSGLVGLMAFLASFFLLNLAFDSGGLGFPLFLPTWPGFLFSFLGMVACVLVLLLGTMAKSRKE